MARRRYLSTVISTDKAVASLIQKAGPIAALLYTWMIPHAADDASLPTDPEELLSSVAPILAMRGIVTVAQVELTIDACIDQGLLVMDANGLRFPDSFFKHQTYIRGERRGAAQVAATPEPEREVAQISAESREPAQNIASSSSSSSLLVSSLSSETRPSVEVPKQKSTRAKPAHEPLTDEQRSKIVFDVVRGGVWAEADVQAEIDAALNHDARFRNVSENLYVRNWLRKATPPRQLTAFAPRNGYAVSERIGPKVILDD
jgi:hypothetical protein